MCAVTCADGEVWWLQAVLGRTHSGRVQLGWHSRHKKTTSTSRQTPIAQPSRVVTFVRRHGVRLRAFTAARPPTWTFEIHRSASANRLTVTPHNDATGISCDYNSSFFYDVWPFTRYRRICCRTPCPRSVDKGVKLFLPSPVPADNLLSSHVPHLSLQTCNLSPRRHLVSSTLVQLCSDFIQACLHTICESAYLAIPCDVTHAKQRTADVIRLQPFSQCLDYVFCGMALFKLLFFL